LRRRRFLHRRRRHCRLAGVQDDFFGPFLHGPDSDDRSIKGWRLISEGRWGLWQTRAGDEQQSRKRASNKDKIASYGHAYRSCKLRNLGSPLRTHRSAERTTALHLLARRRRSDEENWLHFRHEHREAQRPNGERGQTQNAPHIGSCAFVDFARPPAHGMEGLLNVAFANSLAQEQASCCRSDLP
jgi:hypothetical protein